MNDLIEFFNRFIGHLTVRIEDDQFLYDEAIIEAIANIVRQVRELES